MSVKLKVNTSNPGNDKSLKSFFKLNILRHCISEMLTCELRNVSTMETRTVFKASCI